MAIKELLPHLSYSLCDCSIDYREEIGVVNGQCPNHPKSKLMVDGVRMEVYLKAVQERKQLQIDKAKRKTV